MKWMRRVDDFAAECEQRFRNLTKERRKINLNAPGQRKRMFEQFQIVSIKIDAVLDQYNSWCALQEDIAQLESSDA